LVPPAVFRGPPRSTHNRPTNNYCMVS